MRTRLLLIALTASLLALSTSSNAATDPKTAPMGSYIIDPDHTSVTFKISHLGFSFYTGRFDKIEGTLDLNATAPEKSGLDVNVYTNSVDTNNVKLEEELRGDKFFDVLKFPRATFHATKIEQTSASSAKITGDLTLKGQTHSIVLDTKLVGTGTYPFANKQVVGFTATTSFHRSDFGISNLLPMVGDEVILEIEAEFDQTP
jgi:polyisoprenoid-binding protein YceI